MDCEKFEPLLIDELYDELDEVTSAAVKRHVSGCSRCASILNGMRATRRAVVLPVVEVPAGLEDRILSAVKEAQKVTPIQSRTSRIISLAGSWAMRPQTAMAAVFLLMIGTSAFVIRSRHAADRGQAVSVTEQGAPAAAAPAAADHDSLDSKAAAAAHGPNAPTPVTSPPVAATASAAQALALALAEEPAAGPIDSLTKGKGRGAKDDESLASALAESADKADSEEKKAPAATRRVGGDVASNAGAPGGAPMPQGDFAPRGQSLAPPPAAKSAPEAQDGFSAGMAAYRARNFTEATRQFDQAARGGDQNAALWAAKSVKDGNGGCGPATARFDAVAQKAGGSWTGHEAQLESARCQIATGHLEAAREKLNRLASVASHASQAQQALNELNQVASRREAERSKSGAGGAAAARPAAPAPARAPAKPAATALDSAKESGF
ncbi:MAG: zf-HC2 domain-containing protein [Labilithrix sp.]|nr:zf-HC2 domain-containing protein [Labilithrix sp.]